MYGYVYYAEEECDLFGNKLSHKLCIYLIIF